MEQVPVKRLDSAHPPQPTQRVRHRMPDHRHAIRRHDKEVRLGERRGGMMKADGVEEGREGTVPPLPEEGGTVHRAGRRRSRRSRRRDASSSGGPYPFWTEGCRWRAL